MPSRLQNVMNGAILMIAFVLPFLYVCSTDYVWQVFSGLSGNVVDSAIALPSGMPIIFIVCIAWISGFVLLRYRSVGVFRAQMFANIVAMAAFLLTYLLTETVLYEEVLNPFYNPMCPFALFPEEGLLNLFPIRLALATLLAFVCSVGVTKCREAQT